MASRKGAVHTDEEIEEVITEVVEEEAAQGVNVDEVEVLDIYMDLGGDADLEIEYPEIEE